MTTPNPTPPGAPQGQQSRTTAPFAPWDTPANPSRSNINPNVKLDTSTTTTSGPDYSGVDMDPDPSLAGQTHPVQPGYIDHYQVGHQVGRAIGQQLASQLAAEIERLFQ
jgi:hypothetical protein